MINEKLHNSNRKDISLLVFTSEVHKRLKACGTANVSNLSIEKAYKKILNSFRHSISINVVMKKWIYDEEGQCIRCNDIPILEGSFNNKESEKALILATHAPQMLDMLKECLKFSKMKGSDIMSNELEKLIQQATTI